MKKTTGDPRLDGIAIIGLAASSTANLAGPGVASSGLTPIVYPPVPAPGHPLMQPQPLLYSVPSLPPESLTVNRNTITLGDVMTAFAMWIFRMRYVALMIVGVLAFLAVLMPAVAVAYFWFRFMAAFWVEYLPELPFMD
jgi:hypothetical protein